MQQSALRALRALPLQTGRALPSAIQEALASLGMPTSAPSDTDSAAPGMPSTSGRSLHAASIWQDCVPRRAFSSSASARVAQPLPAPSPSTPAPAPSGAFSVEIAVQGFEKRYVDMACNTLSDIILLAFAPKAYSALPTGAPSPADAPLALAFGPTRRDIKLPWKRTRFTLIRGPHIDKTGMEQFERREYKSVLSAATNSEAELQRLLDALKVYQFTGVQLKVDVTSAQQVELPAEVSAALGHGSPSPSSSGAGSAAPAPSAARLGDRVVALPAARRPEEAFEAELAGVLGVLRPLVWSGLAAKRRELEALPDFQAWRQQQARDGLAAPPGAGLPPGVMPPPPVPAATAGTDDGGEHPSAALGTDAYGRLLRQRLQQQLALQQQGGVGAGAAGAGAAGAAAHGLDPAVAAKLLARIDAELIHAHESALAGQPEPAAAATGTMAAAAAADGGLAAALRASWSGPPQLDPASMSPAEYAYAVLKYVQYVDVLYETAVGTAAGTAGAVRQAADTELQLAAPSLALRLLQMWWAATAAEFKAHLGLPSEEVERVLRDEFRKRQEKLAEAAEEKRGRFGGGAREHGDEDAVEGEGEGSGEGRGRAQGGWGQRGNTRGQR
ncbi:hypothetical protein HYH03_015549 [Edaphochlamys debaryana]|uniref:Small ribosomal subunit protein uS10 domain-containing protein n=1 Tax=Edaphochlamys debaryana TaxID=47281 RepID=A0A836BR28_9CHLO|nr:hypothetical protein HYH03_015549 [Edaphochlamys debaryana]|eukprot:KAG2485740.1 hypothetical protein HYH03_015549 [Edaphochlamys debaryana]